MAGERSVQQENSVAGAGGFAEPHVEIEQRIEAEFGRQGVVSGFGGDMPRAAVIRHAGT